MIISQVSYRTNGPLVYFITPGPEPVVEGGIIVNASVYGK